MSRLRLALAALGIIVLLFFVPYGWMLIGISCSAPVHYLIFGKLMGAKRWWLLLALAVGFYSVLILFVSVVSLFHR